MDLGDLAFQIATTAAHQAQNAQLAADLGQRTGEAGVFTKILTDLARAMWGRDVNVNPPSWFPNVCAAIFGILGMVLLAIMLGFDLTQPWAIGTAAFLGVTAGGGTSALVTQVHNSTRPAAAEPPRLGQVCPTCGRPNVDLNPVVTMTMPPVQAQTPFERAAAAAARVRAVQEQGDVPQGGAFGAS